MEETKDPVEEVKPDAVVTAPAEKPKRTRAKAEPARAVDSDEPLLAPAELPKRKFAVSLKPHDKAFPEREVEAVTPADAKEEYQKLMGIVRTERTIIAREA